LDESTIINLIISATKIKNISKRIFLFKDGRINNLKIFVTSIIHFYFLGLILRLLKPL